MARSRGTDPSLQAQQADAQAQQRLAYQQAATGQQPPVLQPQPAPKKNFFARHKIITALLVVVAVVVVSQAVSGGTEPTAPAPGASDAAQASAPDAPEVSEAPAAPGVGSPVADGKFQFTVTSIEAGVPHIGDATFGVDAQGQFLLLHVTVMNVGDAAQYFDSGSQKLLDGQGRTHSADSSAAIYLPDSNSFLTSINPGNTVEGIVVFDIPADATPASVELHDSPFSGGVSVTLT